MTSFPMAVKLELDETVVFSWVIWSSREARDEGNKKVRGLRMHPTGEEMLFSMQRMIFGASSRSSRRASPQSSRPAAASLRPGDVGAGQHRVEQAGKAGVEIGPAQGDEPTGAADLGARHARLAQPGEVVAMLVLEP